MIKVMAAVRRRGLLQSIAAGASLLLGPSVARHAHGQQNPAAAWPARPITMVVPFPPGGPTDLVARVLAHQVGEQLGQAIVVENKPGANGNIGNGQVANAPPDGHSVLYNTSSITLSPSLYRKLAYDVERDLAPVTLTAVVPLALVINPSVPADDVKSFIAYARAHPGKLAYGSAGAGNVTHLAAFQFCRHFGIEATHVPYKGSAPADADLVAGQIQFMTETVNSILPYVKDKRLKVLAVTTARRIALFPDAPTLSEAGMGDFEAGAWQGVMVPAKTPTAIVDRLAAELNKALKHPAVLDKLAQQGAEPLGSTPAAYGAYLRKELARWSDIVKATGVTLD
jgi:tripartite-type tricarboxylate transporter receptor subunit TctC